MLDNKHLQSLRCVIRHEDNGGFVMVASGAWPVAQPISTPWAPIVELV